jgi:hypothetical protein
MAISDLVAGTIAEFIDYAMIVVTFMVVWYIIKFFLVAPPTKEDRKKQEEERVAKGKETREWIADKLKTKAEKEKERKEALKKKHEQHEREEHLKHPRAHLIEAIEEGEDLFKILSKKYSPENVAKAEESHKHLVKHLKNVNKYLRRIRRHEKGEIRDFFNQLYTYGGVALELAENISLPEGLVDWDTKSNEAKKHLGSSKGVVPLCGVILKAIDDFIVSDKMKLSVEEKKQAEEDVKEAASEAAEKKSARSSSERPSGRTSSKATGAKPVARVRK